MSRRAKAEEKLADTILVGNEEKLEVSGAEGEGGVWGRVSTDLGGSGPIVRVEVFSYIDGQADR